MAPIGRANRRGVENGEQRRGGDDIDHGGMVPHPRPNPRPRPQAPDRTVATKRWAGATAVGFGSHGRSR